MTVSDTFELTISAVAIFAIFRRNSRSASWCSRARTAEAITRKTPAMFPNRCMPQRKTKPTHTPQTTKKIEQSNFRLSLSGTRERTRRPPRETVAQQSRTSIGFLHPTSNEFHRGRFTRKEERKDGTEGSGRTGRVAPYSGAMSRRAASAASRATGESSAREATRTCTASGTRGTGSRVRRSGERASGGEERGERRGIT